MKRALCKHHIIRALAMSAAMLSGYAVQAETVRVPIGETTQSYSGALPARGATKATVEAQFGPAESTHGPSGQPPIYFWEYPDFTVYFEYDHVIHTVTKTR